MTLLKNVFKFSAGDELQILRYVLYLPEAFSFSIKIKNV